MRAALYARVSTVDKGQDPEVQLRDLRDYAARRGFEVVVEFVDFASGHRNGRPEYQRMFDAARKRRFDVLLVWRYDRFARSMQELVNALEEFRTLGIDFISYIFLNHFVDTSSACVGIDPRNPRNPRTRQRRLAWCRPDRHGIRTRFGLDAWR